MKKIQPITEVNGIKIYDLNSNKANADPVKAARLAAAAKKGNKEAEKELNKMMKTPMYREE